MTTPLEAARSIYDRFITGWGTTTDITFENENFSASKDSDWVRLSVGADVGGQETLGPVGRRQYRRTGIIFIEIFTPEDIGVTRSRQLIQQARNLFEGVSDPEILFFDGNWRRRPGDESGYYSVVLEIEFTYFETK